MTENSEQIEYWNGRTADLWVGHEERLDRQLDPLGRAARAALALRPGEHVLDVGCGSGQTTLQLGDAVGPTGRVLGVDVSAPLLAVARRRGAGPSRSCRPTRRRTHSSRRSTRSTRVSA
jgi:cyclopropane fatty-acyl-phospholipid synthase-like methyltransferase